MDKEKKNIIYMINKLNIIKIKNLFEIKPNKLYILINLFMLTFIHFFNLFKLML